MAQGPHCSVSLDSASTTRSAIAGPRPGALLVVRLPFPVSAQSQSSSLNSAAAGATTEPNIGDVLRGRNQVRRLLKADANRAQKGERRHKLTCRAERSLDRSFCRADTRMRLEPCRPTGSCC